MTGVQSGSVIERVAYTSQAAFVPPARGVPSASPRLVCRLSVRISEGGDAGDGPHSETGGETSGMAAGEAMTVEGSNGRGGRSDGGEEEGEGGG